MMHRFLIDRIQGDTATLTDAGQLHHIRDVLRLKVNDEVIVFDNHGHEYKAVIITVNKKQAKLKVTPLNTPPANNVNLTIACAIPKGSRMDDIIDFLTQLGVASIIPMRTERVVVKLDDARAETRHERWQKIARNAARQCQRSNVPAIAPVTDIKQVISNSREFDLKLIPHLAGERKSIKDVMSKGSYKNIIALIGPEGDFTPAEVELALHNGFNPVSLGSTVLRVATAAIAVAAYIRFALDE
ncbi:MAG: RsmE family RNA methyltransferase [Dehalococcoidales bacterium]